MTAIRAQLLEMMRAVASALGEDLRSRLVFVGKASSASMSISPTVQDEPGTG